jgi:hypothetical protein
MNLYCEKMRNKAKRICFKRKLSRYDRYIVAYVTTLVRHGYIDPNKLYNVYVYLDMEMKKIVFFDLRKINKAEWLANGKKRSRYFIRLFTSKRYPLLRGVNVILCLEEL